MALNEEDIQPFQHPRNFWPVNLSNINSFTEVYYTHISLYKSCEQLKAKCLNLETRVHALEVMIANKNKIQRDWP
jgi:hypothetical protein